MSSHENHTVILLAVMMIVASTTAVMMISDQSEAALGTYEGGINSSSESNPYTGIDFQFSYSGPGFLNNIYVLEGSYVSIDGEIDSVNNYMVGFSSVTSGYGLSLTRHTTDGTVPNDIISGTLSRSGTITIEATIATSFGVNNNTYTIYVVPTTSVLQITSTGGTEATVGYEYRYDVQTTPSNAIISISGVDWLSVSGHTISGTPDQSGDYVLTVTANLQGYTATDETVRIHVSEEQISQDVPTLGEIYYTVSSSNPYSLEFHVSAENASVVRWDFGDGNISSTGTDVTHVYSSSGSYTVRATATNSEGSVTKTIDVLIADRSPATTVQYNHAYSYTVGIDAEGLTPTVVGCPFLTVTNGGNYVTVSGTPSSTAYVGQTYDVVLTVGEFRLSWSLTVSEGSTVPTAGFTVQIDGLTVIVTSTATNADMTFYQWTDGGSFVQSNTGTTRYTYSEPGTYTITQRVTATVDGQTVTDEFSRTVTVDGGSTPEPTPESDNDSLILIVGIALAVLGIIVLAAGAYTRNYIIATAGAVLVVLGVVLWWMF